MRKYFALAVAGAVLLIAFAAGAAMAAAPAAAAPAPNVWKKYIVESSATGKIERFWVGHAAGLKPDGQYPVIYFLPGLLDGDDTWQAALDPHLGKYEIIAVCPAVGGATWYINSPAQPWMKWGDYLTEELRGFVESHYPASREKGQRGIAGISAGAMAFYHAVTRPDLYSSVSVISGACELRGYVGQAGLDYWIGPKSPEATPLYAERSCVALADKFQAPPPFELFLDAGDKDGALQQMTMLRSALEAKKVKYKWFVGKGGHDWSYWNTRADEHLAWHADQFAQNRLSGRFPEKSAVRGAALKELSALPDIALSAEAAARLKAPWTAAGGAPQTVTGLAKDGSPLSKSEPRFKEVRLASSLSVAGHKSGVHVFRLTLRAGTPLEREGTLALRVGLRNGRTAEMLAVPATLVLPEGARDRRVDLRARLVIEARPPDPLRGGIVAALQVFDAAGNPVGAPTTGKALPGSVEIERWPVAPQMGAELVLSLTSDKAFPVAAVYDARVEAEP
ncbi:MAG: alpha/beta hydrolase-fold protein [Planctomycetota bacterium]|nr:alpha/beta hydrolase-fold protein [Planctomycetota bacterium]